MNIQQATKHIKGAIEAYLCKDDHGLYCIPFHMQRPIIMLGPPGVGKTAIVAQIAEEMDINFVAYSITHHTRQSALGLPFITQKEYAGREYSVSEYTMSEIIGAVHDAVAESGVAEGVLFLDEVNCVSETLAPAMLQFLQYKTFGMHRLPEGWIIVTAGNPPEYNRAAREFDPAMMDRMKRIDVAPDVSVWQEYAAAHGVHPAITTYLDAKPGSFYKMQASAHGSRMVTARGWEDLSRIILAYERKGLEVDGDLVAQYLQDPATAEDFEVYYQLFRKYRDDYKVVEILAGQADESIVRRAGAASFDERLALVGLLIDALLGRTHEAMEFEEALRLVRADVLALRKEPAFVADPVGAVEIAIAVARSGTGVGKRQKGAVGNREVVRAERLRVMGLLLSAVRKAAAGGDVAGGEPGVAAAGGARATGAGAAKGATTAATKGDAYEAIKAAFNAECKRQAKMSDGVKASTDAAFEFLDAAFGEGSQEALVFITKLSADPVMIKQVSEHGSTEFMKHNKSLLFHERGLNLLKEIEASETGFALDTGE